MRICALSAFLILFGCGAREVAAPGDPLPGFTPDTAPPADSDPVVDAADDTALPPGDEAAEVVPAGDTRKETLDALEQIFDPPHGFFEAPFSLTLTSPVADASLYYTLDSSDPTGRDGVLYTAPLTIAHSTVVRVAIFVDREPALPIATQTYVFPAEVPAQAAPEGWPEQWWEDDEGGPYTADYDLDPEVTASADYSAADPALFSDLAVLSLVLDPDDLWGRKGLYENPLESGEDWERLASAELIRADGTEDFTVNCGARIHGGAGRRPDRSPKKSFRLLFKDEYGPATLDHPLYEDSAVEAYNTLVIRAGYNRAWVNWQDSQRERSQYARETFANQLLRDLGGVAPRVRPVHLFLDGLYWGLYQIEERPDAFFLASHLGGAEADYDAINSGELIDGDLDAWQAMLDLAEADLSDEHAYAALGQALDLDAFADYLILELFLGNADWPAKNWWAFDDRASGGPVHFVAWDSELTMSSVDDNFLDVDDEDTPGELFQALRANEEFLVRFGDRVQRALFNDGALTPEALRAAWDAATGGVVPGVVAESARWGDHWLSARGEDTERYTYAEHWLAEYARITEEYFPFRGAIFLEDLVEAGLYPPVAAPELAPFGGAVALGDTLNLSAEASTLYYTLDGSDPRLPGGAVSPSALLYDGPLALLGSATLSARAWDEDEGWSALVRADFSVE